MTSPPGSRRRARPEVPQDPPRRERDAPAPKVTQPPGEVGGPRGPEPTRYGDWERGGRCIDF